MRVSSSGDVRGMCIVFTTKPFLLVRRPSKSIPSGSNGFTCEQTCRDALQAVLHLHERRVSCRRLFSTSSCWVAVLGVISSCVCTRRFERHWRMPKARRMRARRSRNRIPFIVCMPSEFVNIGTLVLLAGSRERRANRKRFATEREWQQAKCENFPKQQPTGQRVVKAALQGLKMDNVVVLPADICRHRRSRLYEKKAEDLLNGIFCEVFK